VEKRIETRYGFDLRTGDSQFPLQYVYGFGRYPVFRFLDFPKNLHQPGGITLVALKYGHVGIAGALCTHGSNLTHVPPLPAWSVEITSGIMGEKPPRANVKNDTPAWCTAASGIFHAKLRFVMYEGLAGGTLPTWRKILDLVCRL
jgi:hypothetical protein